LRAGGCPFERARRGRAGGDHALARKPRGQDARGLEDEHVAVPGLVVLHAAGAAAAGLDAAAIDRTPFDRGEMANVTALATYVGNGKAVTNMPGGAVKKINWKKMNSWGKYLGWAEPYYG